jgi:hypothetical protein
LPGKKIKERKQMNKQQDNNQKHAVLHREESVNGFLLLTPYSLLLALALALFLTGCVSALKVPQIDLSGLKPPGPVATVVAAWEPAVSNGDNPQRGFGGRVYLYDQERPVKAKGTIVVYIFEEDGRKPGDEKPNEGLVFTEKMLNTKGVYQKSKIGHSYNLWVPVDAAGPDGPAKKVSLIVRYIPEKGSSIVSSQTTAHLPGRRNGEVVVAQTDWNIRTETMPIQQVSAHREPTERPASARPQTLEAVTIR